MSNLPTANTGNGKTQLPDAFKGAQRAKAFANEQFESASAGITGGFGVLSYGGKVWTLRYKGQEYTFMRPDGDGPRGTVEVVIVRFSATKSKTFYPGGYKKDSHEKPSCWSSNALTPDAAVPPETRQHDNCTLCPQNKVGSRINEVTGRPGRACGDHKRLAVVPDASMLAGITGLQILEPVLLRVPADSLNDFGAYGDRMENLNYPLPTILTRIGFDTSAKYPKLTFNEVRPLTDEEGEVAMELRNDPLAVRIVGEVAEGTRQGNAPLQIASSPTGSTASTTSNGGAPAAGAVSGANGAAGPPSPTPSTPAGSAVIAPIPSEPAPPDLDAKLAALLGP